MKKKNNWLVFLFEKKKSSTFSAFIVVRFEFACGRENTKRSHSSSIITIITMATRNEKIDRLADIYFSSPWKNQDERNREGEFFCYGVYFPTTYSTTLSQ